MYKFLLSLLVFAGLSAAALGQKVTLDYYFNHEVHTNAEGKTMRYHYLWDEKGNTGFSIWGDTFKSLGATLDTVGEAPTATNLQGTAIYIIVDPDSKKENPNPHYITPKDADVIAKWVKSGGVLVMMANDSANVDLQHFNILAAKFGLHFNNDLQNHVIDDSHFEDGVPVIGTGSSIFKPADKFFIKDACSISAPKSASAVLRSNKGGLAIAVSLKYGKGTVFAVGDPWLYNEYVNGRLPAGFENNNAAIELSKWLIAKTKTARRNRH
ncbi:hypothetical protein [Mucilaginibacter ginkgonis]|uniref:Unsaturated rhamnogalacturonyl hydrolase n=1 Tax=Mucilaginibacter ginkgonis TaxID=2682091 RepID=A0A6I4IMF4_9SPHI|nr:hypothetical protein [Mucilaginibacter ginkgonis]QQL50436.1 hypothetical protein GO620_002985 [Mucilaginibacter ginkgonis]